MRAAVPFLPTAKALTSQCTSLPTGPISSPPSPLLCPISAPSSGHGCFFGPSKTAGVDVFQAQKTRRVSFLSGIQALSRQPAVERPCLVLVGVGCLRGRHWSKAVSPASGPVQLRACVRPRNPMLYAGQQQRLWLRQPLPRLFSGLSHCCPPGLARSVFPSVFSLLSLFCVAGGPRWFHCPLITALAIQPRVLSPGVFDIALALVSTLHLRSERDSTRENGVAQPCHALGKAILSTPMAIAGCGLPLFEDPFQTGDRPLADLPL
ncbi:hypothetical protein QBC34DRAFT_190084 [Podospora aff. communis PSN243]|uniref:Uncharacterized protein n=1 Tax=Podospora aff. communis PSN243 TaxID=3040156 RepID=A0AAV9GZH2_9PEZI|nr:hypothetical protein QBC34DRAFT_190084 [Podospora aff. communis PSN243]